MTEKDKSYWQERQEKKYLAGEKKINSYYKGLEKAFEQSKKEIRYMINDFYWRYAEENQLTFASAQLKLSKMELGELQDFIDLVNENMGKYNQELNNMSIKARITRYQALEMQIDATLQQLYSIDYQQRGEELLKEIYSDSYYQTWFNIDQYHGFHQEFAQISAKTVEELIKYPFNGADFSTRLWKQKEHMLQQLGESITTMLIQGKNPNTLSKDFAKKFGTKEYEAYRLLHTEGSFIMGQGTLAGYKEEGVEKYQILATLDIKTSDTCRHQDGKVYDVGRAVVGVNYWPFHMSCRTTDVPYYEDSDHSEDTRVARDPVTGKTYDVPTDMTYEEWHKKYIEGVDDITSNIPLSIDKIEKSISNLSGASVNLKNMDPEVAKDYLKGIEQFYKEYPQLGDYVQTINNNTGFGTSGSFNIDFPEGATFKAQTSMSFANRSLKDYTDDNTFNIKNGFKYEGSNGYTTAMHELTHALGYKVCHTQKGLLVDGKYIEENVFSFKKSKYEMTSFSKKIYDNAKKELFGKGAIYSDYADKIAYLGDYAKSNADEMIAQCVSYEMSGKTNPFSAKIKELFDKEVRKVLK